MTMNGYRSACDVLMHVCRAVITVTALLHQYFPQNYNVNETPTIHNVTCDFHDNVTCDFQYNYTDNQNINNIMMQLHI